MINRQITAAAIIIALWFCTRALLFMALLNVHQSHRPSSSVSTLYILCSHRVSCCCVYEKPRPLNSYKLHCIFTMNLGALKLIMMKWRRHSWKIGIRLTDSTGLMFSFNRHKLSLVVGTRQLNTVWLFRPSVSILLLLLRWCNNA